MNLKRVILVILCITRCKAGVVSRNFKSDQIEHRSVGTSRLTQNKILITVERKNISEHFNSTSRDVSNINSIQNDKMIPNGDPVYEDSDGESSSSMRNTSEGVLRTETLQVDQPLNIASNEQDFRNHSNNTSPNVLTYENASNFIEDVHKEVDLDKTFLDHEMQLNGINDFLTNQTILQNLVNVSEKFYTEKLNETKNPGGLFSGINLDFLINSEVARNAAKAMEVFNFTDPLTDHIFEANELHSFLDPAHGAVNQDSFNEIVGNSTLANKTILFFNTTDPFKRNFTILESNGSELHERNGPLHLTNGIAQNEFVNVTDALKGNGKVEWLNLTQEMAENDNLTEILAGNETNLTKVFSGNELSQLNLTRVVELNQLNKGSAAFENINSTKGSESKTDLKCPPSGFCILWFWSQDACELDAHCLGSRICCRVRCSKTCIDVEKL